MKAVFAIALATACIVALCQQVDASPSDMEKTKDTKAKDATTVVKDTKAQKDAKKKCQKNCSTRDPICAYVPSNSTVKPKTFDSSCHMDVDNCEHGTKYVFKNKGQCV
ncbi:uncharacterized protein [Fopius arisanus]|uniref:LOCU_1 protein n=1 Tax=Fopius arisanus TaxID=64838 RepID=A0A0C9Q905_9HYME|nr:PREDICTED: uncharacterized protein LOC105265484 [Fopius arisanus]